MKTDFFSPERSDGRAVRSERGGIWNQSSSFCAQERQESSEGYIGLSLSVSYKK